MNKDDELQLQLMTLMDQYKEAVADLRAEFDGGPQTMSRFEIKSVYSFQSPIEDWRGWLNIDDFMPDADAELWREFDREINQGYAAACHLGWDGYFAVGPLFALVDSGFILGWQQENGATFVGVPFGAELPEALMSDVSKECMMTPKRTRH